MLRPKKMKKVRLIVLKSQTGGLVKERHEAGLVDIRKTKHEGLDEGRPLGPFDEVSAQLLKLRASLTIMEGTTGKKETAEPNLMRGAVALEVARELDIEERIRK